MHSFMGYNRAMDAQQIYDAINPAWFSLSTPNNWQTAFYSSVIVFDTPAITNCEYTISAPYQTNGLSPGTDAPTTQTTNFINNLRLMAANRLAGMYATAINGYQDLSYVYNATA